jgi:hypothetical protein
MSWFYEWLEPLFPEGKGSLRTLNWSVDSKCATFHSFFEGEMKNALIFEE